MSATKASGSLACSRVVPVSDGHGAALVRVPPVGHWKAPNLFQVSISSSMCIHMCWH